MCRMDDLVIFEFLTSTSSYTNQGYGKLINRVKGNRNHYASKLMVVLVENGYKEVFRERFTETRTYNSRYNGNKKHDVEIIKMYWLKGNIND